MDEAQSISIGGLGGLAGVFSIIERADEALFLAINGFVGTLPFADWVAEGVVSDYMVPVALALALIAMWFMERERDIRIRHQIGVFAALSSMALASLMVFILNMFYFRPRPFEDLDVNLLFYRPTDSSFPSNAVAAVFGIAFAIWGVQRKLGWAAIAAASLYGLARVYAGVHYPLDILGGVATAAAAAWVIFRLRDLLMPLLVLAIRLARVLRLA